MYRPLLPSVFFWVLLIGATGAVAEEPARNLLDRMSTALREMNYEGTFVYVHDQQLETMHIAHAVDADGHRERLVSLNGAPREIIRDEAVVTCILPDSRSVVVEKSRSRTAFPASLRELGGNLENTYRIMLVGQDRVAGRDCRIIGVMPKDGYRYGYRMWLDSKTALPLRMDLLDKKGNPLEQVMFTEIQVGTDIQPDALKPAVAADGFTLYEQPKTAKAGDEGMETWMVEDLPPGFELVDKGWQHLPTSKQPVRHFVFSDGLASVSVYIEDPTEKQDVDGSLQGASQMGAVSAFGRLVDQHSITVVGEVPRETVRLIGESVRRKR